jgi:hypothetical protein
MTNKAEIKLEKLKELVNLQACDEGLWSLADTAHEAYLQQELRRLHGAIETDAIDVLIKDYKELLE